MENSNQTRSINETLAAQKLQRQLASKLASVDKSLAESQFSVRRSFRDIYKGNAPYPNFFGNSDDVKEDIRLLAKEKKLDRSRKYSLSRGPTFNEYAAIASKEIKLMNDAMLEFVDRFERIDQLLHIDSKGPAPSTDTWLAGSSEFSTLADIMIKQYQEATPKDDESMHMGGGGHSPTSSPVFQSPAARPDVEAAVRLLKSKQKEQMRMGGGGGGGMVGIDSNSRSEFGGGFDSSSHSASSSSYPDAAPTSSPVSSSVQASSSSSSSAGRAPRQPVKGMYMSLNPAGAKNKSVENALMREDKLAPLISTSKTSTSDAPATLSAAVAQQPISLSLVEKVSATLSREGTVELFEIKGSLTLTAADDEAALCSMQLKPATSRDSVFSFNTHPWLSKSAYEKTGLLQLSEGRKGFAAGRRVSLLKWYHSGASDDIVPIKVTAWIEEQAWGSSVLVDYTTTALACKLHDVRIAIPLGTDAVPVIVDIDPQHRYDHNRSTGELTWSIDLIGASNTSGSLEFNVQQRNSDAFFPIAVNFASQKLYSGVEVVSVNAGSSGAPVVYGLTKSMSSEEYIIH